MNTDAFSQMSASRGMSLGIGSDDTALLELDVKSEIAPNSDVPLVEVTNNVGTELNVSVNLIDQQRSESVSPTGETSLPVDQSQMFTAYIDSERGSNVEFNVVATDTESISIDLQRQTTLSSPLTLSRSIIDNTRDTNAQFDIQYQVSHVSGFDRIEIDVQNQDRNLYESFIREQSSGVISYPSNGTDGGAAGNTYEFTFRVFDGGSDPVIEETTTRVADGEGDDDDDDFGSEDDPELEWFTVEDQSSSQDGTVLIVNYQIDEKEAPENFGQVDVVFDTDDDPGGHWADETIPAYEPNSEITHTHEGTFGSTYEVTLEVKSPQGITLNTGSVTIESGSNQTVEWP